MKKRNGEIWKQAHKKNYFLFFVSIIFSVLSCLFSIGIALMLKEFIDIGSTGFDKLLELLFFSLVFIILNILINCVEAFLVNRYVKRAMININKYISKKVLSLPIRTFSRHKNGSYISLLNNDLKVIEQDYLRGKILLVAQGSMVLVGIIAMVYINYKLTLVVLVSAVLPLLISTFSVNQMTDKQEKVSKENRSYTSFAKDYLTGFSVIKSFHIENRISDKASKQAQKLESCKEKYQRYADIVAALSQNSTIIMVIILFLAGAAFTINGEMTIGGILAFVQLLNNVTAPINIITPAYAKYNAAISIMENAEKLLEHNTQIREFKDLQKNTFEGCVKLKNVSFSFEAGTYAAVENIDFEFKKGKSYAIVGLSGSGKSTLLKLLAGYYDNFEGQILIDDVDIRDISEKSVSEIITLVQQETFLFDDTIENNIKLYQEWADDSVKKAIDSAVLTDVIEEKGGMDAVCGENGASLSGGQKQRISIARALLKNSPILLLDEATSALDIQTAYQLEESLAELKNITRIAITHKLDENIMKYYDCVIMIKDGRIQEYGTLDELLKLQGEFYKFYNLYLNSM